MLHRRKFLKSVPLLSAGAFIKTQLGAQTLKEVKPEMLSHREYWLSLVDKISKPVLESGSARTLKARMKVETTYRSSEKTSTYLEAVGRLLAGIAPWLESDSGLADERALREKYRKLSIDTITSVVDPKSPDYLFNHMEPQMLVDAAFLAHAFLRAPKHLWLILPVSVQNNVITCFLATRDVKPYYSNWLLFSALIEAFFLKNDLPFDIMRLDLAVKKHQEWYLGDGMYGDGPDFHWDYYNSYVIQPMLIDIVTILGENKMFNQNEMVEISQRFTRYAAIQERLISPEGTFPVIGRSITYRMGAFQHLAQAALQNRLPNEISPAQVRCALSAVMKKLMSATGTFSEKGWLQIGLVGHQNTLGESYISTGSLYLCSTAFLPLGLPNEHPFWNDKDRAWTSVRIWNGENLQSDHAL